MNSAAKSNTWGEGKLGRSWKGRHYYPSCTYLSYQKLNEFGRREAGIKKWWAYENSGVTWELVGGSYWCAAPPRESPAPPEGSVMYINCMLYEHKTLEREEHTLKPCARCTNCSTFNLWSLFVKKKKHAAPQAWFHKHTPINTTSSTLLRVCPLISASPKIPQTVHTQTPGLLTHAHAKTHTEM